MKGIAIADKDSRGVLAFDLRDVLRLLGRHATESYWEADGPGCTGPASQEFYRRAFLPERISGHMLLDLANGVHQVVDGEFRGFRNTDDDHPWITVRATDSSSYDVETDDNLALETITRHFRDVTEVPT